MIVRDFLRALVNAFPYLPYDTIRLTWHRGLARWEADLPYWRIEDGLERHPWGWTPEEAVRNFVSQLKGKSLIRTGQNGNWGRYQVDEEITCEDMAFSSPQLPPPETNGFNEVVRDRAIELVRSAEMVFLLTYLGNRPIKGFPEKEMVEADREGKGLERLLVNLGKCKDDCPIEVGIYDDGKTIGFRGGLL